MLSLTMHVHASANIIYMQYAFNVHWGRMLLLRTYLVSVLRGEANGHFVKWSGLKCSTWVSISRQAQGGASLLLKVTRSESA